MPNLQRMGKDKVLNHHHEVPYRVLEHKYNFGDKKTGSMIVHGDNLEALKSLLPQYEGKVKCCYIDPPYNTGNEGRVYNDNVNHPKIKKWLHQVVGKEGDDLSRHDKWLCMMYPRLKLLHKLLAENGAIFISIDDSEQANLKLIMDEIFGGNNFVANIIRQHSIQPKGYLGKFSVHHNYTFVYQKSPQFVLGNLDRTDEHNKAYSNPDNDPRGKWRSGDVRNALYRPNLIYDITTPSGKIIKAPEKGRRRSKETLQERIKTGEIVFSKDQKRIIRKIYLDSIEGRAPETIWFGKDVGTTRDANKELKEIFDNDVPFDTPKPVKLIEQIMSLCVADNDIILDSFAGSGTTGHATLNFNLQNKGNNKFILIEMEDYADNITAERIKRVIKGYGDKKGTGGGFDYYTLGEALFDEDDNLNESIDTEIIKQYIRYTETQTDYTPSSKKYLLGTYKRTEYYFYYEHDRATTLDLKFLGTLGKTDSYRLIYADICLLSKAFLAKHNIIFKKIPRDITRF